jgi:hypothetical protein
MLMKASEIFVAAMLVALPASAASVAFGSNGERCPIPLFKENDYVRRIFGAQDE